MIKLEHVVLASPEQMKFIIEGMRNPMNSWEKSDTVLPIDCKTCSIPKSEYSNVAKQVTCDICKTQEEYIGPNDYSLMQRLANAGTDHRKFMRMMPVYVRITAPLYLWKELDTYKVGTVANSCSTMHKIQEKEFTREDFSFEHLDDCVTCHVVETGDSYMDFDESSIDILDNIIESLNIWRSRYLAALKTEDETGLPAKDIWWQMIQLLPSSYNQTRNVMMNYEVLANIYKSRKNHKLDEWRELCTWIKELPCYELITGEEK